MSLCHMTRSELDGFDALQGMPLIDEKTGYREYPLLAKIIEIPGVKDIFYHVRDEYSEQGHVSSDLHKIYKKAKEFRPPFEKAPGDQEEPTKQLSEEGTRPDDEMAWLPDNLVQFMLDLEQKEPNFNPKDGLLQFGFFRFVRNVVSAPFKAVSKVANAFTGGRGNEIVRIAGTIGGALFGGPMGAGLGNALASYGTGKDLGQSLWSGVKNYGLATGIQGAGQMAGMHSATPYAGGFFGGSNPLVSGGHKLMQSAGLAASSAPTMGQVAANAAGTGAAVAGQTAAAPGILSSLASNPILPIAAMGLLTHQADKRQYAHEKAEAERERKEREEHKHRVGYYKEWKGPDRSLKRKWVENPKYTLGGDEPYYSHAEYYREPERFKTGGALKSFTESTGIKGPGNGQDDAIRTEMPAGTYIIDATSTAHLGDGSSECGIKALKKTTKEIRKKYSPSLIKEVEKMLKHNGNKVPVYVANDEFKIDPVTVCLQGEGNIKQGAKDFRKMVKNIRIHKASNGLGLPPAAKTPMQYLNMK